MIFGPLLKLRDKITRKRHSLTEDTEKPFLEHLDDLRKTITRIVITLLIAVIGCFMFNEEFFKLMKQPFRNAGLDQPREYNLPESVKKVSEESREQQDAWWRIQGTARGMADLDGALRESFLKASAPDEFTRHFAWALLLYHCADSLPKDQRSAWIADAVNTLPEPARGQINDFAVELREAATSISLEKPANSLEMEAFAPGEGFTLSMKLSLFAGIIISFPFLFYFLLEFILPGLTARERKMIFPALAIGFGLFLTGVAFAWYVVVPQTLEFFHDYDHGIGIRSNLRIGYYVSFVTSFTLIFGLVFETPVVIMVMVKLGLLTSRVMRNSRGWAVIIILVSSAIITPTGDMLSMSFMAAPMIVMFECCIWLAWLHERKAAKREREEQRMDQARRAALIGVASVEAARPGDEPAPETLLLPQSSDHTDPPDPADHPHHPEPDDDYEQYLRDHAGHYTPAETHPETIPVDERPDPAPAEPTPAEPTLADTAPDEPAKEEPAPDDVPDSKTQNPS